ncbi:MAG TPA: nodulation protein NfeD [Bacteroidota bacterium]|nr:nodulation protein NfeD [Bacteroidota bacterium]
MRQMILFLFAALILPPLFLHAQTPAAYVITIDGTINPASAEYLHSEIQNAADHRAACLIVRLNTPGGLLKSTRVMVSDMLDAPLPVVVYVAPAGAQAASAGVFITLAAHLAVMAPGTNIGAAHPVTPGAEMDSIMLAKTTNDAAAFIRTISEKRHRNIAWAEEAVRKSVSLTETEALKNRVIDTTASSLQDLLNAIDGRSVAVAGGTVVLDTKHAGIIQREKTFQENLLDILSDPNIAYIFMMLGIYGLLFELYNPGAILPGIVGVIGLILAFYSMHSLPVNYAGLGLILFGVILFLLELKLTSHGFLTAGGILSIILGSVMLFQSESGLDMLSLSWQVILVVVVFTALFFVFAIGMGLRAQRRKPTTGSQGLVGETGEAITPLAPSGKISIHGEIWNAQTAGGAIDAGSKVVVSRVDDLTLVVHRIES